MRKRMKGEDEGRLREISKTLNDKREKEILINLEGRVSKLRENA
jgi:hypothetical protein